MRAAENPRAVMHANVRNTKVGFLDGAATTESYTSVVVGNVRCVYVTATDVGPTDVGPTDGVSTDVATTHVGTPDVGPTAVGHKNVWSTDVAPTHEAPTDVGTTDVGHTDTFLETSPSQPDPTPTRIPVSCITNKT